MSNQTENATETGDQVHPLVISVRQPWAWLIINAGKDIENRNWFTKIRGRVLIHAGKGMTRNEYLDARLFVNAEFHYEIEIPAFEELQRGGIIGSVEIVDCVERSDSPWFFGRYGFVLKDPQPMPFHPLKGQLGFFRL